MGGEGDEGVELAFAVASAGLEMAFGGTFEAEVDA